MVLSLSVRSCKWIGVSTTAVNRTVRHYVNVRLAPRDFIPLSIKSLLAISTSEDPTPESRPMNPQLALSELKSVFTIKVPDLKISLEVCIDNLI